MVSSSSPDNSNSVFRSVKMVLGFILALSQKVIHSFVLPGLAILFYCIGELEEDGLMFYVAFFWLILTVAYFGAFFFMLWYFGKEALAMFQF